MNGILKEFFSVSRVLTKPGQTIEISMLNAFNSTNAASARLLSAAFDGPYAHDPGNPLYPATLETQIQCGLRGNPSLPFIHFLVIFANGR